jgi:UDP-N-acetylmuramoyl-tripeptide--D-alanyl-D-alanine ligase
MEISELYKIYKSNSKICTDTRRIQKDGLFFALKGEKFNGNKFAAKAISDGCSVAIIDEKKYCADNKFILVHNVLKTLQDLAKYHREQLSIPIIGITGTNGKTTSKELIHSVLQSELNCYSTRGNLNNHIGVPLSILEIDNDDEIAIIEMGANHKKEILFLCDIAKPTHGVITNIGSAHLEGFKGIQGVIDTKNELYNFIKGINGFLFVNDDDELLVKLANSIQKTSYGLKSNLNTSITSNTPFLNVTWKDTVINSRLIGDYQFYNISLAICIGNYFKISKQNIQFGIESYIPKNNRSEIIETEDNIIIMDAYNANPSSMKAMITSFSKQDYANKLCILGDMLELGQYTVDEHSAILDLVATLNLEVIIIGKEFSKVSTEAFKDRTEFEIFLKSHPIKNKTILLKGSRGISLEKLTKYL